MADPTLEPNVLLISPLMHDVPGVTRKRVGFSGGHSSWIGGDSYMEAAMIRAACNEAGHATQAKHVTHSEIPVVIEDGCHVSHIDRVAAELMFQSTYAGSNIHAAWS